jgi:hypothetical protein
MTTMPWVKRQGLRSRHFGHCLLVVASILPFAFDLSARRSGVCCELIKTGVSWIVEWSRSQPIRPC